MDTKEQLIQGLSDAGCTMEAAEQIGSLYETGSYREMLHQMKVQRCTLIEQMHESQRKVDRMDFLIRNQEKKDEVRESEDKDHDEERRTDADAGLG